MLITHMIGRYVERLQSIPKRSDKHLAGQTNDAVVAQVEVSEALELLPRVKRQTSDAVVGHVQLHQLRPVQHLRVDGRQLQVRCL